MTEPGSSLSVRLSWRFVAHFVGFAVMVAVAVPSLLAAHDQLVIQRYPIVGGANVSGPVSGTSVPGDPET